MRIFVALSKHCGQQTIWKFAEIEMNLQLRSHFAFDKTMQNTEAR
nr:MAG TPA: hypothetical protein [Caudoviricetes sp.]